MIEEAKINEYYSAIADKLDEMIPCEWERIVMYAEEVGNARFATFYFIRVMEKFTIGEI